jgi:glycerol uptake facilitator-like aquaporin
VRLTREAALWRRLAAELLGSAFLAAVVIGSGIAAQTLSPGSVGLQLLENAVATAAGLYAVILMFGPVSGGHFNPVVSFVDAGFGGLRWRTAIAYLPAQVAGCIGGSVVANLMFSKAAVSISTHQRASGAHFLSEIVATLGLVLVVFALARSGRSSAAPAAVGAYIGAAYFFTSSTSFANPAITLGRMFSNTFAGIAPSSVPSFIAAQVLGGALAFVVIKVVLYPGVTPTQAEDIIVPHHEARTAGSASTANAVPTSQGALLPSPPSSCSCARTTRAGASPPRSCSTTTRRAGSTSAPPVRHRERSSTRRWWPSSPNGASTRRRSSPSPSPTRRRRKRM